MTISDGEYLEIFVRDGPAGEGLFFCHVFPGLLGEVQVNLSPTASIKLKSCLTDRK